MPDQRVSPESFRTPTELEVTPCAPRHILIVGSCLSERWAARIASLPAPCTSELYLLGVELPGHPTQPPEAYDFLLVQPALRFVLPDAAFARLAQDDLPGHQQLLAHAIARADRLLERAMRWNQQFGLLTFVVPFIVPMQNAVGRLFPRYDLRNPVAFIERLNQALAEKLGSYTNAYLFDLNEVFANYGRRFVQEDVFMAINHGGIIGNFDFEHDQNRLEQTSPASELFDLDEHLLMSAAWRDLLAMYRTARQADMVKLVVFDLDDTLWRGVLAEASPDDLPTNEGWPLGLWEAALLLKRRGILLAINSKNDPDRITPLWDQVLRGQIKQSDFAAIRMNWRPKPENLLDIMQSLNLLPENVVCIDDNPAERAAIKAAFPAIRLLGGTPLAWRRILLWAPETQVAIVTPESASRTEMILAQAARDALRNQSSQQDFLSSLNVWVSIDEVASIEHPRFARALELINRTNQFNTTGQRWTTQESRAAFEHGAIFLIWDVSDRYSQYGLVGVAILSADRIAQLVMSCRVMGLETETAAIAHIIAAANRRGIATLHAILIETPRNLPCRQLFAQCGFQTVGNTWTRETAAPLPIPPHLRLSQSTTPVVSAATSAAEPNRTTLHDIIFGREGGNEAPHLGNGWSPPERQKRWAVGLYSELTFDVQADTDIWLEFDIVPCIRPPAVSRQRLFITANDVEISRLILVKPSTPTIALRTNGSTLKLRLDHPDAASPAADSNSLDKRLLAICFRRLRIYTNS